MTSLYCCTKAVCKQTKNSHGPWTPDVSYPRNTPPVIKTNWAHWPSTVFATNGQEWTRGSASERARRQGSIGFSTGLSQSEAGSASGRMSTRGKWIKNQYDRRKPRDFPRGCTGGQIVILLGGRMSRPKLDQEEKQGEGKSHVLL